MPRVSFKLTPTAEGGFTTRKRIPRDVQEEYARLYGKRSEDWFNTGPVPATLATAKASEWHSEIAARFANIRAERRGEGRTLTPQQARALSGEWYHWFVARHIANAKAWGAAYWEHQAGALYDALHDAIWEASGEPWSPEVDPMEVWEENDAARQRARPIVADHAESAQFLHSKGTVVEPASRDMFLDCLIRDYFAAMRLLVRRANDDYGTDKWPERFPKFERTADPGLTPWALFEWWVKQTNRANSTVNRWRVAFLKLQDDFPEHSAASLAEEEAQRWADGLIDDERSAVTVRDVWVVACRTVFGWAVKRKLINRNPFAAVHIDVPRKTFNRDSPELSRDEIRTILSAAAAIRKPKTKIEAAKRWVPWVQAYTGARGGEITQLRGVDVIERDGIPAIKIKPEAGTVKTGQARTVPLHEHLIEQGFLSFAHANGKGPLFYNESTAPTHQTDPTKPPRPRSVITLKRVAEWIRKLGVDDTELQPTHAWRDTFKAIGHRHRVSERILDAIAGHRPATVGRGYGPPTLHDMAEALKAFPRYEVTLQLVNSARQVVKAADDP
jgi:integrase